MTQLKFLLISGLLLFNFSAFAQDITQRDVPSVILNHFQQNFPKAKDIEWEFKGELYKVEFEIGIMGKDHDVWYDKNGSILKHKEEILSSELPETVKNNLNKLYPKHRIKDVKKITQGSDVQYELEAKHKFLGEEWDLVYNAQGELLSKKAD